MSPLRSLLRGLRSLVRKDQVNKELDDELNGFLEMAAEEKIKEGMSRADALRAVRLERGSLEATKEVVRSAGWESFVETLWQDLRFAARMLGKNPRFTAVAVLTLALGIGANTAIFSIMNATLFHPLPYRNANEIVAVWGTQSGAGANRFSAPNFLDVKDQNRVFESVGAFGLVDFSTFTGQGSRNARVPRWQCHC